MCVVAQEKASYKAAFGQLRDLKAEIEHLQLLLGQSRKKLQQDFQQWLAMVAQSQQQQHQHHPASMPGSPSFQQPKQEQDKLQPPPSMQSSSSRGSSRPGSARHCGRSLSSSSSTDQVQDASTHSQQPAVPGTSSSHGSRPASRAGGLARSLTTAAASGTQHEGSKQLLTRLYSSSVSGQSSQEPAAGLVLAAQPFMREQPRLDLSGVDPKLLQIAAPYLTGNAEADADIIKFYEARERLLQMKQQGM